MFRRATVFATAAVTLLTLGGGPAFAGTNGPLATTDGSSAKWFHDTDFFRICDTDADGDSVYVKFHYSGSGGDVRLNWTGGTTGGDGGCVDRPYGIGEKKVVYYQSCQDDAFNDTCSDEVTGIA